MLTSVAALACSLLVRPAAVPLHRTPAPARLSSPQMSTEERVEQLVDWVPAAAVPPLTVHTTRLTLFPSPHQLEGGPAAVFRTSRELEGNAANMLVPMRALTLS